MPPKAQVHNVLHINPTSSCRIWEITNLKRSPFECLQPHFSRDQCKVSPWHTHFTIFTVGQRFLFSPQIQYKIRVKNVVDELHRTRIGGTWSSLVENPSLPIGFVWYQWILRILPPPKNPICKFNQISKCRHTHVRWHSKKEEKNISIRFFAWMLRNHS